MRTTRGTSPRCQQPATPQQIDEGSLIVEYGSSGDPVEPEQLRPALGLNECSDGFYFVQGGLVVLCPDTCTRIQKDTRAELRLVCFCRPGP